MCIDSLPEPWGSFLRELDELATEPVDFHCIGGFVVKTRYGFEFRFTDDLDVLSIIPKTDVTEFLTAAGRGSEMQRKHGVFLDYVTVIWAYPEDYDQRLTEMYAGQLKNIRLFAVEAHDLALMKLERNSSRDRDDVLYLAKTGFITSVTLRDRYEKELRPYVALAERSTDITLNLWVDLIEEVLKQD
jgi:hypothetical protein